MSRNEARLISSVLALTGLAIVALAIALDKLRGVPFRFGPIQLVVLLVGLAILAFGLAFYRSHRVQDVVGRIWPFESGIPEPPRRVFAFALWLAVVTALLQLGLQYFQFEMGHRWGTLNPHAGWMVVVSYLFWMGLLGGPLSFFAARRWTYLASPRWTSFVFLLFVAVSVLSVYHVELHWAAMTFLSLGIAFQGSRLIVRHREGIRRFVKRSALPVAVAAVLVAIGPFVWPLLSERRALATMPDSSPDSPNVLLIILDTVRAQNLGLYGYVRETTPNLDRLAGRATVYEYAFSPTSWTLPSHAGIFTGYPPHQQSSDALTPLDDEHPTLAEVLRDRGYYTFGVVANPGYTYPHTGLARGFVRYHAGVASWGELINSSTVGQLVAVGVFIVTRGVGAGPARKNAQVVTDRFLDDLDRRGERPFFAFLNYFDAHTPYADPPIEVSFEEPVPHDTLFQMPEMRRQVDRYDKEIAYIDNRLGMLFRELENRRILENTIVVVTSDHGEEFTEHGMYKHGLNLYNTTIWVPLLVFYPPRVPEGRRVHSPVALKDIPKTVMSLLGADGPFPGQDLVALARPASPSPAPVLSELSGKPDMPQKELPGWKHRSLIMGRLHYIRNPDHSEELYDFVGDPWEMRNLATSDSETTVLEGFRATLSSLVVDDTASVLAASPDATP